MTGAASGIGQAIAMAFAAQGADLVLCDLDLERLDHVALGLRSRGVKVHTSAADVADATAVQAWADQVALDGPVNVVVNNAGIGVGGMFMDTPPSDFARVVAVNLVGVAHGCHAFIPLLRTASGRRALVNISSASGYGGTPGLGAYAATKAAVLSLSETLQVELEEDGIQVHCVCPGFVRTDIFDKTDLHFDNADGAVDRLLNSGMLKGRDASGVADALLTAIARRRFLVPVYTEGVAGAWLRHLPEPLRVWSRRQVLRRMRTLANGG